VLDIIEGEGRTRGEKEEGGRRKQQPIPRNARRGKFDRGSDDMAKIVGRSISRDSPASGKKGLRGK